MDQRPGWRRYPSAKANVLICQIYAEFIKPEHFNSVDIYTKDLDATIFLDHRNDKLAIQTSFLNRVAKLGYLAIFNFSVHWGWDDPSEEQNSNPLLTHFNLCGIYWLMK